MSDISTKLTYLNETKNLLKTQINYGLSTEQQITSSTTFREYVSSIFNAFLEALRTPDTLFTNLPKKSGTGANITLNDTANAPMRIELGASELTQAGTPTPSSPQDIHTISGSNTIKVCGKNLFDYASASDTNNTFVSTYRIFEISGLVPNAKYTLNKMEFISSITGKYVYLWTTPSYPGGINQIIANPSEYHNTKIFNASADGKIYLTMYPNDTTTWNELIPYLKNAQIEAGENNTTYEPYISQEAEVDLGTNMFNKYTIFDGDIINGYFKIRLCSRQDLYLKAGTYTFSTNMPTTYKWLIQTQSVGVPPLDAYPTYDFEYGWTTDASKTFTLTNDGYFDLQIQKGSNQNLKVADIIDYDFQLVKGSEVLPFKEYREPIEYCKIGNYEDKFIKNSGKNLLNVDTIYSFTRYNLVKLDTPIPAGDYYISWNSASSSSTNIQSRINLVYTDDSVSSGIDLYYSSLGRTITFSKDVKEIRCYAYGDYSNSAGITATFYGLMISKNGGTYEPYGSNEWYIKKNIGKVVLDGTENWEISTTGIFRIADVYPIDVALRTEPPFAYSNYYKYAYYSANITSSIQNEEFSWNGSKYPVFRNDSCADATAFKTWLSNNNTTVYYVLSTPTYTQITGTLAEQLENVYQKLLSYDGTTNISQINNDLSFNMSIQAIEK